MDRGAWQATVHGVTRVAHNFVTKPPDIIDDLPRRTYIIYKLTTESPYPPSPSL